jgi:hypothetical protein
MNTLLNRLRRNARRSERAPIRTASYPRHTTRGHRPLDPELHIIPPFALLSSGPR